jgi:hypothetical protein
MGIMTMLSYAIKVCVSAGIIWLSITIVDKGNYRNKIKNAFITALILTILGYTPFAWIFGLVVWVFILINWYSIGFFKSFLCVIVYMLIFFLLNMVLAAALVGGAFTVAKMADTSMYKEKLTETREGFRTVLMKLPASLRKILGIKGETGSPEEGISAEKVRIRLKNGRELLVTVLMEGKKGLLVDIANGRSEVVIRKDTIERIEE